jgi:hypothetical protein
MEDEIASVSGRVRSQQLTNPGETRTFKNGEISSASNSLVNMNLPFGKRSETSLTRQTEAI